MALSITYVRPDRVIKTGVIAPYPIRTDDPVALARNVVGQFVNSITANGPVYQNPQPQTMAGAMLAAAAPQGQYMQMPNMPSGFAAQIISRGQAARREAPGPVSMGNRQVAMRNGFPQVANMGQQVIANTAGTLPRAQYDAARAQYRWAQATSRGSVWDRIFARQREMRMLGRGR